MMNLLGDDGDSDGELKINEAYAKRYEHWRQGEELQKLKDKFGDAVDDESDSSSSDDENADELTEDIEKQFFKTLSCLKKKDEKIYDENVRFFDESSKSEQKKVKKQKPVTIAEYQRKLLIEKGGDVSEDDDEPKKFEDMTNVEQEKAIKNGFKQVLADSDVEEEDWGGMFKKKSKSKEEQDKEEENYRQWLAGEKKNLNSKDAEEMKTLHDYWTDPNLDEGEKFLRDYVLNKTFLNKDDGALLADDGPESAEEEEYLERQEEFERKYNFRFEEPDQDFIKRYPRTLENTIRKKDDRRKEKREKLKTRKEIEKRKKDEELKRLKALKKKEILDKIKKLQEVTGNTDLEFQDKDIDGDFDPSEHDRRMSELFDNDYYAETDEDKPEFPDLDEELEIENWDDWGGEVNEPHCEDPNFNMDCDYDPAKDASLKKELLEATKGKRKKRRQSKFAAVVEKPKPLFDPKDKTFEQYIDDYYSLDYEDLIGDLPCRFKYRKVVPNDYGLSVEEILSAPDKELNRWASVKKIMQRRPENVEQYDVVAYRKKAKDFNKKKKVLPTLYAPKMEEEKKEETQNIEVNKTKKRKKSVLENSENKNIFFQKTEKINNKRKRESGNKNDEQETVGISKRQKKNLKKKKKGVKLNDSSNQLIKNGRNPKLNQKNKKVKMTKDKKVIEKKLSAEERNKLSLSDARLKAYGLNPKKFKNKVKYRPSV